MAPAGRHRQNPLYDNDESSSEEDSAYVTEEELLDEDDKELLDADEVAQERLTPDDSEEELDEDDAGDDHEQVEPQPHHNNAIPAPRARRNPVQMPSYRRGKTGRYMRVADSDGKIRLVSVEPEEFIPRPESEVLRIQQEEWGQVPLATPEDYNNEEGILRERRSGRFISGTYNNQPKGFNNRVLGKIGSKRHKHDMRKRLNEYGFDVPTQRNYVHVDGRARETFSNAEEFAALKLAFRKVVQWDPRVYTLTPYLERIEKMGADSPFPQLLPIPPPPGADAQEPPPPAELPPPPIPRKARNTIRLKPTHFTIRVQSPTPEVANDRGTQIAHDTDEDSEDIRRIFRSRRSSRRGVEGPSSAGPRRDRDGSGSGSPQRSNEASSRGPRDDRTTGGNSLGRRVPSESMREERGNRNVRQRVTSPVRGNRDNPNAGPRLEQDITVNIEGDSLIDPQALRQALEDAVKHHQHNVDWNIRENRAFEEIPREEIEPVDQLEVRPLVRGLVESHDSRSAEIYSGLRDPTQFPNRAFRAMMTRLDDRQDARQDDEIRIPGRTVEDFEPQFGDIIVRKRASRSNRWLEYYHQDLIDPSAEPLEVGDRLIRITYSIDVRKDKKPETRLRTLADLYFCLGFQGASEPMFAFGGRALQIERHRNTYS